MIRPPTRTLTTVALLFLASVATASAEDDRWELWLKDTEVPGPYRVLASFETRQDCIKAMERRYVKAGGVPIRQHVESGSVLLVTISSGRISRFSLRALLSRLLRYTVKVRVAPIS